MRISSKTGSVGVGAPPAGGLARLLLGLLSLSLGLVPLVPFAPAAQAQEAHVSLEAKWLLLRKEDVTLATQVIVQLPDQTSSDGRGQLTVRRFDPDYKGRDSAPPGPTLALDKLWLANDIGTAQQIYQEQANAGFAEAPTRVDNVGGVDMPGFGDESRAIGGCAPCESGVVHFRVVFRYINAVHVLYVYGLDQFVYRDVVINLGRLLDERIRAVPTGPAPDVVWNGSPRTVGLSVQELGKQIDTVYQKDGSDDRAQWYEARFKRQKNLETAHVGPLDIYNKVWVAPDIDTAHAIFAEQSVQSFPEADDKEEVVGDGQFPMENLPGVGNENFGWSACNDNCNTEKFRFLHHRYVFRVGNMVSVIYTWGGNQDNNVGQVGFYAQSMRDRMK